MSQDTVQTIIGKIVTDSEFRKMLKDNPEEALKGYELTEEEKQAIMSMDDDKVNSLSESLDQRITKGFYIGGA